MVKAYGTTQDADNLYFITEFVPGGEVGACLNFSRIVASVSYLLIITVYAWYGSSTRPSSFAST